MDTTVTVLTVLGLILILLSIGIYFFSDRRKFYRRNQSGIEEFNSYSDARFTRFMERLLQILRVILLVAGLICCFLALLVKLV